MMRRRWDFLVQLQCAVPPGEYQIGRLRMVPSRGFLTPFAYMLRGPPSARAKPSALRFVAPAMPRPAVHPGKAGCALRHCRRQPNAAHSIAPRVRSRPAGLPSRGSAGLPAPWRRPARALSTEPLRLANRSSSLPHASDARWRRTRKERRSECAQCAAMRVG